ncbi:hypothetical protein Hanom_Chr15g01353001 [Helianthus anomalus]
MLISLNKNPLDWKVWGPADARLGPAPDPHTAPWGSTHHTRRPTAGSADPLSSFLLSHIPIHIYIYIHEGVHPPPPRSILSKPLLRGAYVAAHPLQPHPLHTL